MSSFTVACVTPPPLCGIGAVMYAVHSKLKQVTAWCAFPLNLGLALQTYDVVVGRFAITVARTVVALAAGTKQHKKKLNKAIHLFMGYFSILICDANR
jgi:hypothetical protein